MWSADASSGIGSPARADDWRALLDHAATAVAVWHGPDHVFEYSNVHYRELVGLPGPAGNLQRRKLADVLPALADHGLTGIFDRVYRSGRAEAQREFRTHRDWRGSGAPEERFFDFTVQPVRVAGTGETTGVMAFVTEVTDKVHPRTRIECLLRLTAAVNHAADVDEVFQVAVDGLCERLDVDRAAILLFDDHRVMRFRCWRGLSDAYRAAVEGHSPWSPDDIDAQPVCVRDVASDAGLAGFWPVFEREQIRALAFVPLVHQGELLGKFMLYAPRPRTFASDELQFAKAFADQVAGVVRRKLDQIEREQLIHELRDNVRTNELLAAILGHDLRNPLASILTAAELITRFGSDERATRVAGRIITSSRRMSRMIEQLLDYTRVRQGVPIPVDAQPIELVRVVRQVTEDLQTTTPDRRLDVRADGDTHGSWDPFRGGRNVRRTQGLGLGLHITRELVRAHGGSIEVRSSDGEGTTFEVQLPRLVIDRPVAGG